MPPVPLLRHAITLAAMVAVTLAALPTLRSEGGSAPSAPPDGQARDPSAGRPVAAAGAGIGDVPAPARVPGRPPVGERVAEQRPATATGRASWYGPGFAGRPTASGRVYDPSELVAAHRSLPFGTRIRVTNRHNGLSVVVRVVDRGPYAAGRILDLSRAAAEALRMRGSGSAPVTIEVL